MELKVEVLLDGVFHCRELGSTLVICTEGNAGFYEIGIMVTPLDLGYSVLGWNHPGFGWSTVSSRVDIFFENRK